VSTDAYNRSAQYTNVPPGKYTFRVKGSNNDGIWNDQGIAITVIISPPWYTTWGFRGGAAGAGVYLVYIMVMTRIRQINRKHTIEKQILEMERQYFDLEQKALRLQMNPHFIFNTLNSIQSYMISNEAETAIEYLAKFARLMRQVLANSRESFIPVKEELAALQYYLEIEQLRFEDKFEFEFILDPAIDDEFTGIPPMILQPYIENAIIHGLMYKSTKGKVTLRMEQRPDYLFCVIEDDGVGREKAMQMARDSGLYRKSSGMLITQQRLDILNQNQPEQLKVMVIDKKHPDGTSSGTRIEIHMPIAEI
jgi:sensor histidine kinase YesM